MKKKIEVNTFAEANILAAHLRYIERNVTASELANIPDVILMATGNCASQAELVAEKLLAGQAEGRNQREHDSAHTTME